ncbi:hypothetical protein ACFPYM_06495, partial [Methylobacterium hispanicum]
ATAEPNRNERMHAKRISDAAAGLGPWPVEEAPAPVRELETVDAGPGRAAPELPTAKPAKKVEEAENMRDFIDALLADDHNDGRED